MSLCCSLKCERRLICANSIFTKYNIGPVDVEDLYTYGHGHSTNGYLHVDYVCGMMGDYKLFEPIKEDKLNMYTCLDYDNMNDPCKNCRAINICKYRDDYIDKVKKIKELLPEDTSNILDIKINCNYRIKNEDDIATNVINDGPYYNITGTTGESYSINTSSKCNDIKDITDAHIYDDIFQRTEILKDDFND